MSTSYLARAHATTPAPRWPRVAAALVWVACAGGCVHAPAVIENSLGMRFVQLPRGEFRMGSDESVDRLASAFPAYGRERLTALTDEAPVHQVRITRPFFLGQHEVTVGQFRRFLELSGYVPESVAEPTPVTVVTTNPSSVTFVGLSRGCEADEVTTQVTTTAATATTATITAASEVVRMRRARDCCA